MPEIVQTPGELKRQLGLRTATALVVGEVIAVGIFLTPAGMLKSLGSPMWLLFVGLVMRIRESVALRDVMLIAAVAFIIRAV